MQTNLFSPQAALLPDPLIAASAGSGLTSKEIGELLDKPLNEFSGRLTELKAAGRIQENGERNGAAVLRAK